MTYPAGQLSRISFLVMMLMPLLPAQAADQLIVFVNPEASPLAESFQLWDLESISKMAEREGLEFKTVNVQSGAPAEVTITPLIVFQNAGGRSIYQGRYTTLDRLRTFIRTSRVIPQGSAPMVRTDVPVWQRGRSTVNAPIKITSPGGDFSDAERSMFVAEAHAELHSSFKLFSISPKVELGRADRAFYFDVHPHRSGEELFLSLAVFSQFNCHEPVAQRMSDPIHGAWEDRSSVLAEAAAWFETTVRDVLANQDSGDGWDAIDGVATRSWDELGLALPAKIRTTSTNDATGITLGTHWTVGSPLIPNQPQVSYRFPAPLDNYVGEARTIRGVLIVGPGGIIAGATGLFEVDTSSVTMGEPMLDDALHGSLILDVAAHETASFKIESLQMDRPKLAFGEVATGVMSGAFTLRGKTIPVDVLTTLEPIIDKNAQPRLLMTASWDIRLEGPFGILGPDGPAPANDTVQLRCNLTLEPNRSK